MEDKISGKVFLTGENFDTFVCPSCKIVKRLDRSKLLKAGANPVIKCTCGKRYIVEFRRGYRKQVELPCTYHGLNRPISGFGIIKDISFYGIGFLSLTEIQFTLEDLLRISFQLDTKTITKIEADVQVRRIYQNKVGTDVKSWNNHEKEIWFYLLPT